MTGRTAPLSFGQELFWLLDHATPGLLAYNVPRAFRIRGALDVMALERAFDSLVERHEVLRSVYALVGDHPVQTVLADVTVPFERVDLSGLAAAVRETELTGALEARANYHFDLAKDVMLRATLFRLGEDDHALFFLTHHIVSDGWSKSITFRELSELYAAGTVNRPPALAPLRLQFADHAIREREGLAEAALETSLAYWREQLRGPLPVLDLQTDRPRPAGHSFEGDVREAMLPKSLVDGMRALGQERGATLYMVLLAAYQTLLHRYSGQDDIIVGSPTADRDDEDTQDLIGYFAGALVLRNSFAGDPSFGELVDRVSNTCLDAYEHPGIPFEKLVLELQKGEDLTHAPLFQCVLTMEDTIAATFTLGDTQVSPVDIAVAGTKFDLVLLFSEHPDGLKLRLGFRTALFDGDRVERILGHLRTLLEAAVADPARRVSALPLLTPAERAQLLSDWNGPVVAEGPPTTVVALAELQAAAWPDRIAVVGEDETVPWGELNVRANRIAHWLTEHGAGPDTTVGLCLDRSAAMIVGMLGVLKSGAAYVPLVPDLPASRLAEQLRESGASIVVTTAAHRGRLPTEARALRLDGDAAALAALPGANPGSAARPDGLAYVLFTSGSTGVPKGVAVTHSNLVHYVRAIALRLQLDLSTGGAPWHFGTVSTLGADLGHTAVFPALCSGGTLHVVPAAVATDAARFAQYNTADPLDLLKITPNHLRALITGSGAPAAVLPSRWLVLGGEACPWDLVHELLSAGVCRVLNHYGPTETTVGVCTFEVRAGDATPPSATVPIGHPLANTTVYVRDARGELSPVGVAGELYIGGPGVARGYLGRAELTRERFVADPFNSATDSRLYRTGDRVRWLNNGALEFLGRADDQVKIRGYRVELGEIEQRLRGHPGLEAVAVVLRSRAVADSQLVAYVVAKQTGAAAGHIERPTGESLATYLAAQLPDYMVPSAFVFLGQLPLTPNGKLDRAALPAPDTAPEDGYVAPATATQITLVQIWAEVLKRDRIGVQDSFLALGGHSLLAIRVLGSISKHLGVRLPLRALFDAPTVAELALVVDAARRVKEEAAMLEALAAAEGLSDSDAANLLGGAPPEAAR